MALYTFRLGVSNLVVDRDTDSGKLSFEVESSESYDRAIGHHLSYSAIVPTKTMVRKITRTIRNIAKYQPNNFSEKFQLPHTEKYIEIASGSVSSVEFRIWNKETPESTSMTRMTAYMRFWEAEYIAKAINSII